MEYPEGTIPIIKDGEGVQLDRPQVPKYDSIVGVEDKDKHPGSHMGNDTQPHHLRPSQAGGFIPASQVSHPQAKPEIVTSPPLSLTQIQELHVGDSQVSGHTGRDLAASETAGLEDNEPDIIFKPAVASTQIHPEIKRCGAPRDKGVAEPSTSLTVLLTSPVAALSEKSDNSRAKVTFETPTSKVPISNVDYVYQKSDSHSTMPPVENRSYSSIIGSENKIKVSDLARPPPPRSATPELFDSEQEPEQISTAHVKQVLRALDMDSQELMKKEEIQLKTPKKEMNEESKGETKNDGSEENNLKAQPDEENHNKESSVVKKSSRRLSRSKSKEQNCAIHIHKDKVSGKKLDKATDAEDCVIAGTELCQAVTDGAKVKEERNVVPEAEKGEEENQISRRVPRGRKRRSSSASSCLKRQRGRGVDYVDNAPADVKVNLGQIQKGSFTKWIFALM